MDKISGGYYIKARVIQNSKIMKAPPYVREIWDWLLKEANHSDKRYGGNMVKRGQLFRSYKDIREGLAWYVGWRKHTYCENHTKKAMKALREARMIDTKKELGGVLITIINYNLYQNPKNYERTAESTIERTIGEPLENQPLPDTNKNVKNDKNVNRDIHTFWEYFLLKTGKRFLLNSKRTKLIKVRLADYSLDDLKKAVDAFTADTWEGREGFIDLTYCIGETKKGIDNLEKWLNKGEEKGYKKYLKKE